MAALMLKIKLVYYYTIFDKKIQVKNKKRARFFNLALSCICNKLNDYDIINIIVLLL